jgi:hypothetical protein
MKLPQTGGCQCGKIRYGITEEPQLVYTCHCTECQRLTSSAFSMGVVVPEPAFRLSGSSHISYDGSPTAGASTPDWFAPSVAPGFVGCRGMACTGSGPAPWMIHRGCGLHGTSGPAASNLGSRSLRAMRSSRNSLPHKAADVEARLRRGSLRRPSSRGVSRP